MLAMHDDAQIATEGIEHATYSLLEQLRLDCKVVDGWQREEFHAVLRPHHRLDPNFAAQVHDHANLQLARNPLSRRVGQAATKRQVRSDPGQIEFHVRAAFSSRAGCKKRSKSWRERLKVTEPTTPAAKRD